jgi:hypothetical protein
VVATWELIFVSILMDLIGSARGSGMGIGRGISGHRRHGPGTMIPWAFVTVAIPQQNKTRRKSRISVVRSIKISKYRALTLAGSKNGAHEHFLRP